MILDVSKGLRMPGEEIPFTVEGELPPQDVMGETVEFPDRVTLEGRYSVTGVNAIVVEGELTATARGKCSRCLKPVDFPIRVPFNEAFVTGEATDDAEQFSYEGSKLDLSLLALTLAVLELPIRFLCTEDCLGLCPKCGKNLNEGACGCEMDIDDENPMSALRQLLKNNEEV
jgi:uncharacterized protein